MNQVRILRIVVASPGEVQAERDLLPAVIEELNSGIAKDRDLRLELARWETDAYPGFHPQGPQGLIDPILRIEDCDVLIGIFWKHFGTPTQDAKSGTEHEFRRAYEAWQQQGRPHIMVYFNQKAATPKTKNEADQWGQVLEFQQNFPKEGLWWPYKGKAQFEKLVRRHLTHFIREQISQSSQASQAGRSPAGDMSPTGTTDSETVTTEPITPELSKELRDSYLHWLIEQVRAVPLAGVDPKSISEQTRRDLDLAAVYTALMTQRTEETSARELRPAREHRQLSALAVLNAQPRLALLGDPGSGKSTFINFVALCMAGEFLRRPETNLTVLRAPVPEEDQEYSRREEQHPQPWDHGPLLPLRVILREFVARGLVPPGHAKAVSGDTLWQFIVAELPETLRDFAKPLRTELLSTGGLLLLDGLDEVPEADQRRAQVKAAVEQFAAAFPKMRVLVTSRTYAYQKQDWKLHGFAEAVLAPFGSAQIRRFVEHWYAFVGQVRGLAEADAQGRAVLLNQAIARNPRLYELATRPLLLTLMASLHAWRGGTLPGQREELYADAVNLLLDQWESQKVKRRDDGTVQITEPSLAEWLCVDQKAVRQLLNRLAFAAHRGQPTLVGTADIAQNTLVSGLMKLNLNPDARPGRLVEYLRDRAGLLEPRGVGVFAFPHRTFQEYLAACHLTEQDDFPDNIADLLRAEPNRWREVTLLAGAKAVRGAAANAWILAEALCFVEPPAQNTEDESGYWGALLAAQVLIENKSLEHVTDRNRAKVERIRQWLTSALSHNALLPVDRAQAGDALAVVGDPRFRTDAWYLPDEPLLGFVEIPAGPFVMGSDPKKDKYAEKVEQPQHEVPLPRFYIARYPVTVAQFQEFVKASGHQLQDERSLQGGANHPAVNVTWYDALAYCEWLTRRLQEWEGTPEPLATLLRQEGWQVTLPSEAEWEKAARGMDGRIYPWGNEFEGDRANTAEAGIRGTSAVGCFPQGASPHGVLDMAGNVWEWTRSLWGKDVEQSQFRYPYRPADGRENLKASNDVPRVLRGGTYWDDQRLARCASRYGDAPDLRNDNLGFRVVVLTCFSVSNIRRGHRSSGSRRNMVESVPGRAWINQAGQIATAPHPGARLLVRGTRACVFL